MKHWNAKGVVRQAKSLFWVVNRETENHLCRQMNLGEIISLSDKVVKLRVKNLWWDNNFRKEYNLPDSQNRDNYEVAGMVNICESVLKVVTRNKRNWLTRLNQKVRKVVGKITRIPHDYNTFRPRAGT